MKKSLIFVFAILSLVLFSFISAQNITTLSSEDLENLNKLTVAANPQNWGEILASWKDKILENPVIGGINSFFTSINLVFVIIFGTDYSWSLFMFFVIVFWIFFLVQISGALRMTSIFSKSVSMIIAIGLTILLAQLQLYSALSNLLFNNSFVLNAEPWVGALFYVGVIILLIFLGSVEKIVESKVMKNKELMEKEKEMLNRNLLDAYVGGIKKGFE